MKMLRTIRLDVSDTKVFQAPADPGEAAVTGTFRFLDADPEGWDAKARLAFRSGWTGVATLGHATFVQVCDATGDDVEAAVRALAAHLYERFGAPDMGAAVAAAREEVDYAVALADHPAGTLLAIEREFAEEGISEKTRVFAPPPEGERPHARIWTVVDDER